MSPLPDSWYVMGFLKNSTKILSCYGLESWDEANEIAERLSRSNLCKKIERVHTWRDSPRGPWKRETREYPL